MNNRPHRISLLWICAAVALVVPLSSAAGADDNPATLTVFPLEFDLAGMNEGRQLVVSNSKSSRRITDLSATARYTVDPPGIVRVSSAGYVRPAGKGEATIVVEAAGQRQAVRVSVRDFDESQPLHFTNDIVPLLTRHGCNAGGCHGKASGQNGFKLSLFGFDPVFDYNALVKEGRGRRIFPAAIDSSLLLSKASGQVPHGGGRRLTPASEDYQTLRRWIAQGTPFGDVRAPSLSKLEVVPTDRVLARNAQQQIAVLAHYVDGSIRDVTRQAQFQSNEMPVAAVEEGGLVRTFDLAGEAAVMARYQGRVAVFRATVPLDKVIDHYPDFPVANYIDELALAKWKKLGLVPSALCTDGEFIRRVVLDLCGKLPAPDEVRAFLADERPDKRARLIDRCLDDKDYAAHFALRWGSILRNASLAGSEQAAYAFHEWLRDMIGRNRPYDEFVRGIVAASGEWHEAPAINWYWQMRDDQLHQPVADTAQVFLGLRLQCAKCHHHPYERWSQNDYYGLAGFFSRLGRKGFGEPPPYFSERRRTTGEINPATGKPIEPKLLDGPVLTISPEEDPRHKLVDWMAGPDNPFFAKALANRMWGHLMGRGLVDPVDDMRETNPPSNPALLDAMARDFIEHKFDVKHLLRTICNSRTYQLSSTANEFNQHDKQNHARYYGKRLIAEVLLDCVDQVCETRTTFSKMSKQARAVDLPHENFGSYFLDVFDRPPRSSACECARSNSANLSSVLHLTNSPEINDKIASGNGRVARLVVSKATAEKAVEDVYLAAFARLPTPEEKDRTLGYLQQHKDLRTGLEDLVWALLNTREFIFNH
jgi:Protein of unknown function (DUF1549)/Protein of unknown function (DUF1553)